MLEKLVFDHRSLPSRVLAAFLAMVLVVGLSVVPPYAQGDSEDAVVESQELVTAAQDETLAEVDKAPVPAAQDDADAAQASASQQETVETSEPATENAPVADADDADEAQQEPLPEIPAADDAADGKSASQEEAQELELDAAAADDAEAQEGEEEEAAEPVAMIGDEGYATLAEAFAAAGSGATIKLVADAPVAKTIAVSKNITLNVAGMTVDAGSTTAFSVTSGTLTIVDSTASSAPSVGSDFQVSYTSGGILSSGQTITVSGTGAVDVESGTVLSTSSHAFSLWDGGGLTVKGGLVRGGSPAIMMLAGSVFKLQGNGVVYSSGAPVVDSTSQAPTAVVITNGYLLSGNPAASSISADAEHVSITGGTFNCDITPYLSNGYAQDASGAVIKGSLEVERPAAVTYNGASQEPALQVTLNGQQLPEGEYEVAYLLDGAEVQAPEDAGTYAVKVSAGGFKVETIFVVEPLSLASGAVSFDEYTYTGQEIVPESLVLALADGSEFILGQGDFGVVDIQDNVNAGTATLTVAGSGNFTGRAENQAFQIAKAAFTEDLVTVDPTQFFANGEPQVPEATVEFNGVALSETDDYTVSYTDADGAAMEAADIVEIGTYYAVVAVTENANLAGDPVSKQFSITDRVARIGDTVYGSLEAALEAAASGDTIELLQDVSLAGTVALQKSITLQLGSHVVSYAASGYAFDVAGASVSVTGGTVQLSGGAAGAFNVGSGAGLTVNGGTYTGSNTAMFNAAGAQASFSGVHASADNGYCVLAGSGATAVLAGKNVFSARTGTASMGDSAIAVAGGTAKVYDGTYSGSFGLSMLQEGGSVLLLGGSFTGSTASIRSVAEADAQLVVKGGDYHGAITRASDVTSVLVSGGVFEPRIDDAFVADGYVQEPVEGSANTTTVRAGEAVARIGETTYSSLQDAVDAASAGDTIVLLADVDVSNGVKVGKAVDIDGQGQFAISATGSTPLFALGDNANLTLTGCTLQASQGALFLVNASNTVRVQADNATNFQVAGSAVGVAAGFVTADGGSHAYLPASIADRLSMKVGQTQVDALVSDAAYTDDAEGSYAKSSGLIFEDGSMLGLAMASVGTVRYASFEAALAAAAASEGEVVALCANADASGYQMAEGDVLQVKLGAFALVPPTVPAGCSLQVVTGDDGITTYTAVSAVARVNDDAFYGSLEEAFAAAQANDVVTLLKECTLSAPLAVGTAVTFDLGGKTLSISQEGGISAVSGGKLEMLNGSISSSASQAVVADGGSIVLGERLSVDAQGCALHAADGKITVAGANVKAAQVAAQASGSQASVVLNSGSLVSSESSAIAADNGAAIQVNGGSAVSLAAGDNPPAAGTAANGAQINVAGGSVSGKGAGLVAAGTGKLSITGGTVASANADYPAVLAQDAGSFATIAGGKVQNTAGGYGAYAAQGEIRISAGIVDGGQNGAIKADAGTISVYAGWFTSPVEVGYCADGFLPVYEASSDPDQLNATVPDTPHYTVQSGTKVAQNGDKLYATLAAAVAAANDGDTVVLLDDTTEHAQVKPGTVAVTVDLQGHTVTTDVDNGIAATSGSASKLTLKNGTIVASGADAILSNGSIVVLGQDLQVQAEKTAVYAYNGGAVNIDGATIVSSCSTDFAASAQRSGTINLNAGSITSQNSGALSVVNGGKAVVAGGSLTSSNTASSPVVNVDDEGSSLTVKGGAVTSDTVVAIAARGGSVAISGGTLASGTWGTVAALGDTGGSPSVVITGGTITSTDTAQNGCAVYAGAGTVSIDGDSTTITGGKDEDALYVAESGTGSIAMRGGWVSNAVPANCCETGYLPVYEPGMNAEGPVEGRDGYYTVKIGSAVAQVEFEGEITVYDRLASAMAAAPSGGTVTLLGDDVLRDGHDAAITVDDGRSLVLDLAGHTVTSELGTTFLLKSGSLEVKDSGSDKGGITATGDAFCVEAAGDASADSTQLKLASGLSVASSDGSCVQVRGKATVNTAANLVSSGSSCAILGSAEADGTVLNITGGTVRHADAVAVSLPQQCAINISGTAVVSGTTGMYVQAGSLNVSGNARIEGTGPQGSYSGADATGDALVVGNTGGEPAVAITGGTFVSAHAKAVGSYASDGNEPVGSFISGGWFSNAVEGAHCADGFLPSVIADDETGLWTVVSLPKSFVKAEEAIADLAASAPDASWDQVIMASYWFQQAQQQALADDVPAYASATYAQQLYSLQSQIAGITALDMADKDIAQNTVYTIDEAGTPGTDIGSLAVYTGLKSLDLSDTGITGDLGALAALSKLESLDLSGDKGITDFGGVAALENLKELGLARAGLGNNAFGPIVALPALTSLDLSGNQGITDIAPITTKGAGASTCALSLKKLDVSDTGIASMDAFWNGTGASLPALTTLAAQGLTLDSFEGIANVALQDEGFSADGKRWDFGGSVLMGDSAGNVPAVQAVFDAAADATFIPPTVPVAKLMSNGQGYDSLAAAMADAQDEDAIIVFQDAEGPVEASGSACNLTIDLGGNNLVLSSGQNVQASNGATLILQNGDIVAPAASRAVVADAASVVLENGLVLETQAGTALYAQNGGDIAVKDARVVSGSTSEVAAIATGSGSSISFAGASGDADEGLQCGLTAASAQALLVQDGASATVTGGKLDNGASLATNRGISLVRVTGNGSSFELAGGEVVLTGLAAAVRAENGASVGISSGTATSSQGNALVIDGVGTQATIAGLAAINAGETGVYVLNDASATVTGGVVTSTSDRASALSVDEKDSQSTIQVSGGWFSSPVLPSFCAPDYAPVYVRGYDPTTGKTYPEYLAHYTVSNARYAVTFLNEDGQVLETQEVGYGAVPVYTGQTPTKESTDQYDYEFAGWDPEIAAVTANTQYTAVYEATLREYMVTFQNEDGTVLQTGQVAYGTVPAYSGEKPTKEADAQNTYEFAGWDKELTAVTGDAVYTATFSTKVNTYTITWLGADDEVLEVDEGVAYGETPEYNGDTPVKEADAQYSYEFAGWDYGDTAPTVTGNATYRAVFDQVANKYQVTFVDEDGTVLDRQSVAYGTTPVYAKDDPVKQATAQYTYAFQGWDPQLTPVTGDAIYTATYTAYTRYYQVTFRNDDGTQLQRSPFAYGETPVYRGATPEKPATDQYTYEFAGWDKPIAAVTGEATYTAQYDATVNTYTVTFLDDDGTRLQSGQVAYGEVPVYEGEAPTKQATAEHTYTFAGWDKEPVAVTGPATYTAQYDTAVNTYTVTFLNDDGTQLQSGQVAYGQMPQYEGDAPTKGGTAQHGYTFEGWDKPLEAVTGDATYTATYSEFVRTYTITWADEDGTVLDSQTLAYGETPVYSGSTPTKAGDATHAYAFAGWTPEMGEVTQATTYKPKYDHLILPDGTTITMDANESTALSVDSTLPVTWRSSNARVAIVDANGVVRALGPGTARITVAAENGMTLTFTVTVRDDVSLSADNLRLSEGDSSRLIATVNGATNVAGVSWTSSNPSVALVGSNGTVTAVAPGTATITATYHGVKATCVVTVVATDSGNGGDDSGNGGDNSGTDDNGNTDNGGTNGDGGQNGGNNGNDQNRNGNGNNANGNGAAANNGAAGAQDAAATAGDQAANETIEDNATALAATPATPETIEDDANALAGGDALTSNGLVSGLLADWWPWYWLIPLVLLGGLLFLLLAARRGDEMGNALLQQVQLV